MIEKIVREVFEKAEREYASKAKTTLSKYIAEKIEEKFNIIISDRTLSRSYDRYILSKENSVSLTAESVDLLCKYLEFENYSDYREKNKTENNILVENKVEEDPIIPWNKIGIISISILLIILLLINYNKKSIENKFVQCMVWKKIKYIEVSCNKLIPNAKVIPIDKKKMENMKKVILKRSTPIFSSNGRPLYWYRKVNSKKIEFFTAPGLHPVTGKTLKAITKTIFDQYVPIHTKNEDSFMKP